MEDFKKRKADKKGLKGSNHFCHSFESMLVKNQDSKPYGLSVASKDKSD